MDRAAGTVSFGLLLLLVAVVAYTDFRWGKIYNATTYPGILAALLINTIGSFVDWRGWESQGWQRVVGWIGLGQSVLGLLACGGILLICYVFFRLHAGDVKLMAMVGAFLGVNEGIEVLLWTFVIAAAVAVTLLLWRHGAWQLARQAGSRLGAAIRFRDPAQLAAPEGSPLKTMLALAPSSLIALVLVRFQLLGALKIL